jgi:hypothetical protein
MKNNAIRAILLIFILTATSATVAQGPTNPVLSILPVLPGDTVQVATSTALNPTDLITVNLTKTEQPTNTARCSNQRELKIEGPSKNSFSLGIPLDICTGVYVLTASRESTGGTASNGQNKLNISSPQHILVNGIPPPVKGLFPKALFQGEATNVTFLGPSSLKADADYTVRFADYALAKCGSESSSPPRNGKNCFQPENSQDGQLAFSFRGGTFLSELAGKRSVYLVHDGAESAAQELTFVNARRTTPRNYALGVTAGLALLIYFLLSAGHKALRATSENKTSLLTALFLDEETQTYSLSKCQFYAWTIAAILGYVFFAVARSVVQGSAEFPDIPGGVPAILLFSAGTSVVATGIASSRGSKGAGPCRPTLADFITTGGVVAPERLQFVIWTVVGIFTFLTIVFKSDPLALADLPNVPSRFLQLMGISSAGYLAGKLARKPGPVIKVLSVANVTAQGSLPAQCLPPDGNVAVTTPVLTLNLKGENLDPKAKIKVDGQSLRGDLFWIKGGTPDPQSGFCSELNVSLNNAAPYIEGAHTLTFVNTDAQAADALFPIDPMTIESVQVPSSTPASEPDVTVRGTNFVSPTMYQWQDSAGKLDPQTPRQTTVESATQLKVSRTAAVLPGSKYKLMLISPVLLRATSKEV